MLLNLKTSTPLLAKQVRLCEHFKQVPDANTSNTNSLVLSNSDILK